MMIGHFDENHILTVICTGCGEPLVPYAAVCSPGNSLPALYVEPCTCEPEVSYAD